MVRYVSHISQTAHRMANGLWYSGFLIAVTVFIASAEMHTSFTTTAQADLTQHVDPIIGSARGGICPAAALPFGMVQIGPDTPDHRYYYPDRYIVDFSMTHMSGPGCTNKGHAQFLPITGSINASPGTNWNDYRSGYSHSNESVSPGYYSVDLTTYNISVEVTATTRTGFARITYPASSEAKIIFNFCRSNNYAQGGGGDTYDEREGELEIVGDNQITGMFNAGAACSNRGSYPLYIAIEFDRPFENYGTWVGSSMSAGERSAQGMRTGGYVTFDVSSNRVVQMKVGISYVSLANAQQSLATENPNWDFAAVRSAAEAAWNTVLNRVQITGGTDKDLKKFYSAFYHCFFTSNINSDLNGEYRGFDDEIHTADGWNVYQNYSGWDVYRSWIQVVSVFAPEALDIVKSMVDDGDKSGKSMPMWTDANKELNVMVGDPGTLMVSTAYALGVRGFDYETALAIMDRSASNPDRSVRGGSVRDWISRHYYPGNAAVTEEWAMADFSIAQFAYAIGDMDKFETYGERGQYWKNSFNTATGYMQPRNSDGSWHTPFDITSTDGFVEENACTYVWMVPHNLQALFELMGGIDAAIPRLDHYFTDLHGGGRTEYGNIGNEAAFTQPWTYNSLRVPWKSQNIVRRIIDEQFSTEPTGYPGDDDLGSMSSLLVWAYLGMYPLIPGTDIMVLVGPYFPSMTLTPRNGGTVTITATGAGPDAPYVQSLKVNGVTSTKTWVRWRDIANKGTLEYVMGSSPNTNWGINPDDVPPSFEENTTPVAFEGLFPASPEFALTNLYPSSQSGTFFIECSVPAQGVDYLRVDVYTIAGRRIFTRTIHEGHGPGHIRIPCNINTAGRADGTARGIYLARLSFKARGEKRTQFFAKRMLFSE